MPLKNDWKLGAAEGRVACTRVVEEIARRRISRRHLAEMARISLSTLEKVLSGRRPCTLSTVVRLEAALGLSLRNGEDHGKLPLPVAAMPSGLAPDELGNYARPAVAWLEGDYLTIRPSFGEPSAVYAYRTQISWDADASILVFREAERTDADFTQFGSVAVPHQSGHIYLVTNRHGQYRLIVAARPTITGAMHGILTTLKVERGSQLAPVATPIVLVPLKAGESVAYGRIGPSHAAFRRYQGLLARTTREHFAYLLPG